MHQQMHPPTQMAYPPQPGPPVQLDPSNLPAVPTHEPPTQIPAENPAPVQEAQLISFD